VRNPFLGSDEFSDEHDICTEQENGEVKLRATWPNNPNNHDDDNDDEYDNNDSATDETYEWRKDKPTRPRSWLDDHDGQSSSSFGLNEAATWGRASSRNGRG
jgi:hypothetical protein